AVEIGFRNEVAGGIVGVALRYAQRQSPLRAAAQLVISEAGCVSIGVGLGNAVANLVVGIFGCLTQRVSYLRQAAALVILELRGQPRLIGFADRPPQAIVADAVTGRVRINRLGSPVVVVVLVLAGISVGVSR